MMAWPTYTFNTLLVFCLFFYKKIKVNKNKQETEYSRTKLHRSQNTASISDETITLKKINYSHKSQLFVKRKQYNFKPQYKARN